MRYRHGDQDEPSPGRVAGWLFRLTGRKKDLVGTWYQEFVTFSQETRSTHIILGAKEGMDGVIDVEGGWIR